MFHPNIDDENFNPWDDDDSPYDLWEKTSHNTEEQLKMFQQMKNDSERESKINKNRFIIQTVLSATSLIASVVAAVAAIIALL